MVATLAHLSDVHSTRARIDRPKHLLGNRGLQWVSWNLRRRRHRGYRNEILEALAKDLRAQQPGQVVVTGDITNAASTAEYAAVAAWLQHYGDPGWLTAVPGNHDAFLRDSVGRIWQHWASYVRSDEAARLAHDAVPERGFPTLRIRNGLALVGVCSARPSPLGLARGKVGSEQLLRLEWLLDTLHERDLCRVVLTHYPPFDDGISWRRRLKDSEQLRKVLERSGAELVLHGHLHRTSFCTIPGRDGDIPVVGVPSASDAGGQGHEGSRYHVYRIERTANDATRPRYAISVLARSYDPAGGRFVTALEREL
jgi:3',5'-cyclic AMP phosphodiesterase CpdA